MADDSVRIDKYLWAVRIFKTRSLAAEACKKNKVSIDGNAVKTSRNVKVGEVIEVRMPPITRSYKILALSGKRMGAKLVPDFLKEITSDEQLEILELTRLAHSMGRRKGTGRPTKKERRDLENLHNDEWDD